MSDCSTAITAVTAVELGALGSCVTFMQQAQGDLWSRSCIVPEL